MNSPQTASVLPQRNHPCSCGSGKKFKKCCIDKVQVIPLAPDLGVQSLFRSARLAYESGDLECAVDGFKATLDANPRHAGAMHHLGLIIFLQENQVDGITLLEQSLALEPDDAGYLANLGAAYLKTDRHLDAITVLSKAVKLNPKHANAHYNLGHALQVEGNLGAAIQHFDKALALTPEHPDTLYSLGVALFKHKQYKDSAMALMMLVEIAPNHADAFCQLAISSHALGDTDIAIKLLRHAIALDSGKYVYHQELATIFGSQSRYELVICHLMSAVALPSPQRAEIYCAIANAHGNKLKQFDVALDFLQKAIEINPDCGAAHFFFGSMYFSLGRSEEAIVSFRRAIELLPDNAAVRSNLLLTMQLSRQISEAELFAEHRNYAKAVEAKLKTAWLPHVNQRDRSKKLRVGYVSADFNTHSVAPFIRPILANHDKQAVKVYCYYNNTIQDAVSDQLRTLPDHWMPCEHLSDEDLASQIRKDRIDILVDLSGHTVLNRLPVFARKPAPIQITWIGYPGTTGLDAIDYRITDQYMDPIGIAEAFNSERLLRLSAAATFDVSTAIPDVNTLPALGGAPFTFSCLNTHSKFSDENFALWSRILALIPGSRMMFGNAEEVSAKVRLIKAFARHDIDESRLMLMPRVDTYDYLALHHQIDLALDPFPYNGGTTTHQGLRMGVPVVTLAGMRSVSRVGVSVMNVVGMGSFVANTPEEYVNIARDVATQLPELNAIRQSLRARWLASAGGDPVRFTRELEAAYRSIWSEWCATTARPIGAKTSK